MKLEAKQQIEIFIYECTSYYSRFKQLQNNLNDAGIAPEQWWKILRKQEKVDDVLGDVWFKQIYNIDRNGRSIPKAMLQLFYDWKTAFTFAELPCSSISVWSIDVFDSDKNGMPILSEGKMRAAAAELYQIEATGEEAKFLKAVHTCVESLNALSEYGATSRVFSPFISYDCENECFTSVSDYTIVDTFRQMREARNA